MTLQEKLSAARNQAAEEYGYGTFDNPSLFNSGARMVVQNRAAEIMYEVGKAEAQKETDKYRATLEEIARLSPGESHSKTRSQLLVALSRAREVLKP